MLAPLALCVCLVGTDAAAEAAKAKAFLSTWCLDCHDGSRAKGRVNFEPVVLRLDGGTRTVEDADLLRRARIRISDGIMPPSDHEQPEPSERADAAAALRVACQVNPKDIVPPSTAPRRLNRTEYTNTVRDLFGVDVAELGSLPQDDVGAGFDNVAAVLSLSPAAYERMVEIAEGVAAKACPETQSTAVTARKVAGKILRVQDKAGAVNGEYMTIWSSGHADSLLTLPREGVYAISITAFGMQAGPEPVQMAAVVNGKPVAQFTVPERKSAPGVHRAEVKLGGGKQRIGAAFLNDFYVAGPPAQDRNLIVLSVEVEGPLDSPRPQAWLAELDAAMTDVAPAARADKEFSWLAHRVLRRPATAEDEALLAKATAGAGDTREARLRAAIVALLVHPEFLFRIEQNPAQGERVRQLSPHEIATRLSYFLWSSTPDAELLDAARTGALATPDVQAAQVARMLRDPRSSSLSERFAPQWLGIDGLTAHMPDPARFPGVDAALMQSMQSETVMLFDAVLREDRPATEVLDADYTFVDAPLAAHYGVPAPAGGGMRRVRAPTDRGGGVLAHGSVLLATSNPTRTSPVKRGKWVLDSLLDSAPPPPPPGAPALPERVEDRAGLTLRQSLERHRADPACAACHRRMDALGFAFEYYDAVGKHRDRADGAPVDSRGELPDGRRVGSLDEVRRLLVNDPDFVRSLAKHLLVYATGRAAGPADEAAVDALVASAGSKPTLRALVLGVTQSPAFLLRGAPPAAEPKQGGKS